MVLAKSSKQTQPALKFPVGIAITLTGEYESRDRSGQVARSSVRLIGTGGASTVYRALAVERQRQNPLALFMSFWLGHAERPCRAAKAADKACPDV